MIRRFLRVPPPCAEGGGIDYAAQMTVAEFRSQAHYTMSSFHYMAETAAQRGRVKRAPPKAGKPIAACRPPEAPRKP